MKESTITLNSKEAQRILGAIEALKKQVSETAEPDRRKESRIKNLDDVAAKIRLAFFIYQ